MSDEGELAFKPQAEQRKKTHAEVIIGLFIQDLEMRKQWKEVKDFSLGISSTSAS